LSKILKKKVITLNTSSTLVCDINAKTAEGKVVENPERMNDFVVWKLSKKG